MTTKIFPPKFPIANVFVIGSLPQVLQWSTTNGEKKRKINEIEVTDILNAMVAQLDHMDMYLHIPEELKNL